MAFRVYELRPFWKHAFVGMKGFRVSGLGFEVLERRSKD